MSLRTTGGSLQIPVMPSGTGIASYHAYAETQAVVDFLSNEEFDVKPVTIISTDLYLVERVTGQLTMAKAVLSGTSSGALQGAFTGLMMFFASTNQSAFLWVLFGIAGGALVGAFMSGLLYTMTGGRRDFASQSRVVASCYAALASAGIDQAFELLQHSPGSRMRPRPTRRQPESRGPSEYGSRLGGKPRFGVRLNDRGEGGGAGAPRDNRHAAPAQEPAETAVEPAEDSRKPLDRKRARGALNRGSDEGEPSGAVQGLDPGEFVAQCIQLNLEVVM